MPPQLSDGARALIDRQRGLIADWQAESVELTSQRLRRACATDWSRISQHVFYDRRRDLTHPQRRVAAVLECGEGSLLSGRAALLESGWRASDDGDVDVLVMRGVRRRGTLPRWVRVRNTIDQGRGFGCPARAAPARSVVDAAMWARSPREVMFILTSAVQQRLVGVDLLRVELARRPHLRNARAIADALEEIEGGATSANEAAFRNACRRRGLPPPRMQVRRVDAYSRRRRTDAEFRLPDGRLLIVEIDGIGHLDVDAWQADLVRGNGLAASTGAIILRVTGWEVRHAPDRFFSLLVALLNGEVLPSRAC